MKKLIIFFIAMVLTMGTAQAQQASDKAVIETISKSAARIKSMQCLFTQTKQVKMLNEKMVSQGTLAYQQADKLRWEYTSPYKYTFVLNGTNVYIKKGARADKIDVNQSKVFKEIARIMMSTVMGKALSDTRDFKTAIHTTSTEYIATLTPQRSDMRKMFTSIKLHYNKSAAMVTRIELVEKNGDTTVIELKNIKTNVAIPAQTFSTK